MCGGKEEGRVVSLKRTGFCVAKVREKLSLRIGFERAGGGILRARLSFLTSLFCFHERLPANSA